MPLYATSMVMPYRMSAADDAPIYSIQIDAVASTEAAALTTGKALVRFHGLLQHGRRPREVLIDRAQVGPPRHVVEGPYLYLYTRGDRIPQIGFPRRIGDQVSLELEQGLQGLQRDQLHGAIMDCAQLSYINTRGLSALVGHAKRANLHLFRLSQPLQKVMSMVGVLHHVPVHPDLTGAANAMVHNARRTLGKLDAGGFVARD